MPGGETTHLAVLWIACLAKNCSCTHLDHLISRRAIDVGDCEDEPTGLDYQNPIQGPIPYAPQKLSSRRAVNNTDEHKPTGGSNARGGLCWIPGQLDVCVKTGVRYETTYMSAIFGGIGGRADMMWIMGERMRRGPREHGQGLYLPEGWGTSCGRITNWESLTHHYSVMYCDPVRYISGPRTLAPALRPGILTRSEPKWVRESHAFE